MNNKLYLTIICFLFASYFAKSETITISKGSNTPDNVCNNKEYNYIATLRETDDDTKYTVKWEVTNDNGSVSSSSLSSATVKWTADDQDDGYIGKLQATLWIGEDKIATSNEIVVTIQSIQHLKPTLTPYPSGTEIKISPCSGGSESLEVTRLEIPGTGDWNPDKVYDYEWIIPSGWQMFGQTSNGSDAIQGILMEQLVIPHLQQEARLR